MPLEKSYTAIILKKQPLNEADELITVFTEEAGKLRFLAKSVKSSKSKLQNSLQSLFLVKMRVAGRKLPKIIGVETFETFKNIREDLRALKLSVYAIETVLKFTPDEHKNVKLFNTLNDFLFFLDSRDYKGYFEAGLAKFKIALLESSGFRIKSDINQNQKVYFSNSVGGFTNKFSNKTIPVSLRVFESFLALQKGDFEGLDQTLEPKYLKELQSLLSDFIEYQLEREIRSERYFNLKDMV
jgi:DNA repair protein RecO